MKPRYRADRELIDGRDAPVVTDRRRRYGDRVVCFAVGAFMAKRIAAALNHYEQRRLSLKVGCASVTNERSESSAPTPERSAIKDLT